MQKFEDFLKDVLAEKYTGKICDMEDTLERYIEDMCSDDIILISDQYAKYVEQYVIDHLSDYLKKDGNNS